MLCRKENAVGGNGGQREVFKASGAIRSAFLKSWGEAEAGRAARKRFQNRSREPKQRQVGGGSRPEVRPGEEAEPVVLGWPAGGTRGGSADETRASGFSVPQKDLDQRCGEAGRTGCVQFGTR